MTKRQRRQLDRVKRTFSAWWDAVPALARRPWYAAIDLEQATRIAAKTLGPALRELGWQREQVRLHGIATAIWVPPGCPSVKRSRGRPSYAQLLAEAEPP